MLDTEMQLPLRLCSLASLREKTAAGTEVSRKEVHKEQSRKE
jgi:hypothetical protein